ncbi:poly(R)-hydroxyalkanoic acid synthase subunit PhaE [Thermodesulfobacteriota bacterium]
MDTKANDMAGAKSLLEAWVKSSAEFWKSAAQTWSAGQATDGQKSSSEAEAKGRVRESWESSMKTFQSLASTMSAPEAMEGLFAGLNSYPDVLFKLLRPVWDGCFHLQKEWIEKAGRIGKSSSAYQYENLDQDVFKAWTDVYQQEFKQFFQMPQLGLTRLYQERVSRVMDKYNVFQATMAEFVSILNLPVEKSFKAMQEKVSEMADEGKLPDKGKDYYRIWVKILEGHYMTLFKSPEYTERLGRTLDALGEFNVAKQQVLQDALTVLPVPTQEDMDELYKEIYRLKRRVRELEKSKDSDEEAESR